MNPIQLMELHKDSFTQNDRIIYKAIHKNPEQVISKTTSQLASDCGVSQPALTRFIKSLGYQRYRDFRSDMVAWLTASAQRTPIDGTNVLPYFQQLEETMTKARELLTDDYMKELAAFLAKHRRVYATGAAKSYQPAQLFEILMRRIKRGVHAVNHDSLSELVDYMDQQDLLIVFSVSAREKNLDDLAGCDSDVLLVTANPLYTVREHITRAVILPYAGINAEAASVSPVLFDIFVELLTQYMALMPAEDRSPEI